MVENSYVYRIIDAEMSGELDKYLTAAIREGLSIRKIAADLSGNGYNVSHATVGRWVKTLND